MLEKIIDEILYFWDKIRGKKIIRLRRGRKKRDSNFLGPFKMIRVLANRSKERKK